LKHFWQAARRDDAQPVFALQANTGCTSAWLEQAPPCSRFALYFYIRAAVRTFAGKKQAIWNLSF